MNRAVNELISYGINHDLIDQYDVDFVANQLVALFKLDSFCLEAIDPEHLLDIEDILAKFISEGVRLGLVDNDSITERDLFDTLVMGLITPPPSVVVSKFERLFDVESRLATDYFYDFSKATNYIRTKRVARDLFWRVKTYFGELDMSINLSKPEKDPKTIALLKTVKSTDYPKCALCKENVGFHGNLMQAARQNHRIIPLKLNNEDWFFQYSPYVYYNEHSIVFKKSHDPMVIAKETFVRLLDFVEQFNHYFIGANADLPIVGGSILSHDHFQAGNATFPMDRARIKASYDAKHFREVKVEILDWPLTTVRLRSINKEQIILLATEILSTWRNYSDKTHGIIPQTDDTRHSTITPIARFVDGEFVLNLVLRNNRCDELFPDGIFHPHQQYHHLKKENIGLIEVMGLAILPGRLLEEIAILKDALVMKTLEPLIINGLEKHLAWFEDLSAEILLHEGIEIDSVIQNSIGVKFVEILSCCGVFKNDEVGHVGLLRFLGQFIVV